MKIMEMYGISHAINTSFLNLTIMQHIYFVDGKPKFKQVFEYVSSFVYTSAPYLCQFFLSVNTSLLSRISPTLVIREKCSQLRTPYPVKVPFKEKKTKYRPFRQTKGQEILS